MLLELTLLGSPRAVRDGGAPLALGAKPLALLAYLALEPGPHARDELATLLWSDSPPEAARSSLRQALRQLRRAAGDVVRATRRTVELDASVVSDVGRFLERVRPAPEDAAGFDVPRFLAGFNVPRAAAFEEWCEATRGRLARAYRGTLREATRHAMARCRWQDAAGWAERWVREDPLSDEATRFLVEALYMAGDRGEALARYGAHRRRLAEETGAEESAAVRELAERIAREAERDRSARERVAGEERGTLPAQSFEPSLVGREREWERLTALWAAVVAGRGGVLLIEGEAGVGKTRLLDQFLHWVGAEGGTILRGRGYEPGTGVPYAPLVEALRDALDAPGLPGTAPEWLAEVGRIVPEVGVRFPTVPAPSAPGDTDRRWRLFESIAQLLSSLAIERPTVLALDDLHQCDDETCAVLHFLSRRLAGTPTLLAATVTLGDEDRSPPAARLCRALRAAEARTIALTVGPLTEEQVRDIIRELGRVEAPDGARRFAHQIHAATDGNPFHLLELLKALFAQGMLTTDRGTGEWLVTEDVGERYERLRLPRSIRDTVAERYTRLPYELRDLLATVATAGFGVSTRLLSHVHGMSRLRAAALADALVDRRLASCEEGLYRCAHPVIVSVVRDDLTPARRQELHRAIALALVALEGEEAEPPRVGAGDIARHAEQGGERALAYRYALRAAEQSAGRRAYDDALRWLDLAARWASSADDAETVNERTAAILDAAGWTTVPAAPRRPAPTPARGIGREDLDLRVP